MKKIGLALLFLTFCICLNAQQNTFPTVGNVGIGTTSPTEKLTVNGALKVEHGSILKGNIEMPDLPLVPGNAGPGNNQSANQYKFLVVGTDGIVRLRGGNPFPVPSLACGPVMPDGTTIPSISSWEFGLNKIYTKCPEVNVGINNENPRVRLDVGGKTYTTAISIGSADPSLSGNKLLHVTTPSTYSNSEEIFIIENSSSKILQLNNNGSLFLNSNASNNIQLRVKAQDKIGFCLEHNATSDYNFAFKLVTDRDNTKAIGVFNNSVQTFHVYGDGRTVIGDLYNANHSDAKLTVNGKIVAKSLYCTIQSWADNVFENEYKVPSLESVETYYKKHKHLPEIPSEQEVIEKGIDVAEMNKLLLKKIEEMTIILVEQEKRLKALEQNNTH